MARRPWHKLHDRECSYTLPRPGLTDECDRFTFGDVEGHAVYRARNTLSSVKVCFEITDT